MSDRIGSYLKKHSEALVKDLGIERAAEICGKSKATLGRYYSTDTENADRYMPVDVVARLEAAASFPHVTHALADLVGVTLSFENGKHEPTNGHLNSDIVQLSQRFATLMSEYHQSIADNLISVNEAKRLLAETQALQRVLLEMKLRLEDETVV
ncbi:MAG: phage regulatory CII family protein [Paracoccaceae bacterium]